MATHVVINGKEVTNPVKKVAIGVGAVLTTAIISAIFVFILLPLVGIAVTLSVGLIVIFIISTIIGFSAVVLGTSIFAWLFGPTEFRVEKQQKRKH